MAANQILTHPGDILREELKARGLSANRFALDLAVPSGRIVEILNRKRGVSADTALRLSRYLGTSAQVWMNLQAKYDLAVAELEFGKIISERIKPASIELADGTRSTRAANNKPKAARKTVRHQA
jgi:addiction module HigA family antidote